MKKERVKARFRRWMYTLILVCAMTFMFAGAAMAGAYTEHKGRVNDFASEAKKWYAYASSSAEKAFNPSASDKKAFNKVFKVMVNQAKAGKHVVVLMNGSWKMPKGVKTNNGLKVIASNAGKAFSSKRQALIYADKCQAYLFKGYLQLVTWWWTINGRYYAGFEVTKTTGQAIKNINSGKANKAIMTWANNQVRKEIKPYNLNAFQKLAVLDCVVAKKLSYSSRYEEDNIVQSALTRNRGLCSTYSGLYCALCRAAGFETKTVWSWDHVWCAVKVKGRWLYIDPTWDDGGGTITAGYNGWYSVYYKSNCWDDSDNNHDTLFSTRAKKKENAVFTF